MFLDVLLALYITSVIVNLGLLMSWNADAGKDSFDFGIGLFMILLGPFTIGVALGDAVVTLNRLKDEYLTDKPK